MSKPLEDWLAEKRKTPSAFGRELGLRSRASIGRIIRERQASPAVVKAIFEATGGEVDPNAIFGLSSSGEAAA